ncbi:hypothetical protein Bca4012_036966 [Brassica carinata]
MAEYNKLSEVTYNPKVRSWRFRVKLHRIYHFYSYVTNSGPYYNYILADEDGYKMEMTTYGDYENFRGLEREEGRWPTSSPFRLNATRCMQVRIIEPLNNRLFFDFKSIHAIPHMHWRDLRYPIGTVQNFSNTYMVDTMGVVFNTEAHLDNSDHQIKCVVTGDQAYAFRDGLDHMSAEGRRQVIVVLKMWRVWESMSKCCFCV